MAEANTRATAAIHQQNLLTQRTREAENRAADAVASADKRAETAAAAEAAAAAAAAASETRACTAEANAAAAERNAAVIAAFTAEAKVGWCKLKDSNQC